MSKFMTYDYFVDTFKPITNKTTNQFTFETYGEDFAIIQETDPKFIWTEVDGDSGCYIVAGYHYVNRIHYYITENPWDDEYTEVPTWIYRQCDCAEQDENGDYDPYCKECNEGMIDIDCDSVLALKDIYGEDAPIVGN